MSMFSEWLAKQASKQWKSLIWKALDQVEETMLDEANVEGAKSVICAWVQDQHKVPGEFRRIAVREINAVTATKISTFITNLEKAIA